LDQIISTEARLADIAALPGFSDQAHACKRSPAEAVFACTAQDSENPGSIAAAR
jgi:hypothetical protein